MTAAPTVVIGVGNDYRSDDGLGPAVARAVAALHLPDVDVEVVDGDPVDLIELWDRRELAVIVDAVLCDPPTPGRVWTSSYAGVLRPTGVASSHALGVPEAAALAAQLGHLPRRLTVLAVEAADLGPGTDLSTPVQAALPLVVADIAVLTGAHGGAALQAQGPGAAELRTGPSGAR